jgi:hypothetical protein
MKLLDSSANQSSNTIRARKSVVISTGPLQILESSGIRFAFHCQTVRNLTHLNPTWRRRWGLSRPHDRLGWEYSCTVTSMTQEIPSFRNILASLNKEYKSGSGTLAWNFIYAGAKLNPKLRHRLRIQQSMEGILFWYILVTFGGVFSSYCLNLNTLTISRFVENPNALEKGEFISSAKDVCSIFPFLIRLGINISWGGCCSVYVGV